MLIGNLSANYDDNNNIITASGHKISEEQLEDAMFRAKKDKTVILANRLNSPVPAITKDNVDEILHTLTDEAASLSMKEKDTQNVRAEDLRGFNTELYIAAGATGNKALVSQIVGAEDAEDLKNKKALDLVDRASDKNIRIFEGLIHDANSSELVDIETKTKIAENLEAKGLSLDVNEKSASSLERIADQLLANRAEESIKGSKADSDDMPIETKKSSSEHGASDGDLPKIDIANNSSIEYTNSLFKA